MRWLIIVLFFSACARATSTNAPTVFPSYAPTPAPTNATTLVVAASNDAPTENVKEPNDIFIVMGACIGVVVSTIFTVWHHHYRKVTDKVEEDGSKQKEAPARGRFSGVRFQRLHRV